MKNSRKLFLTVTGLFGMGAVVAPIVTGCSDSMSDLKIVGRGDGSYFASAEGFADLSLSFTDQINNAMLNSSGYSAFKKQCANQLLYAWYKKIADSGNNTEFKDNWTKWTKSVNDDYDKQVQNYKDNHGAKWKYYFQNEVLDPNGGTKDAWKYQQMISKVRDAFSDLVFANDYLGYTDNTTTETDGSPDLSSDVKTFTQAQFADATQWKNIDFFPKTNAQYNPNSPKDLDDVYARIQRETFKLWTDRDHPMSVAMSLWKYAEPSAGMHSIYSSEIPNNSSKSATNDDEKTLVPTYLVPAFPQYTGDTLNANGKFYNTMDYLIKNSNGLDANGICTLPGNTKYTDDSDTSMIVSANGVFGALDEYFAGSVAYLWDSVDQSPRIGDHFLNYNLSSTISEGVAGDTDILNNFMFRSNDSRLYNAGVGTLTTLGTNLANLGNYALNLDSRFVASGNGGTLVDSGGDDSFHSHIFTANSQTKTDYYGDGIHADEGGMQWVVNGLRLTTSDQTAGYTLPYVLVRDSFGVHLIGINGLYGFTGDGTPQTGFLLKDEPTAGDYGNTSKMSQGRENLLLKAENLAQNHKYINSSGISISKEMKTFFTSNMDDVIIQMAEDQATSLHKDEQGNNEVIFDDSIFGMNDTDLATFYNMLSYGNEYFLLQTMITDFTSATNKFYSGRVTQIGNSMKARSTAFAKDTESNWSNCLSVAYPFGVSYIDYTTGTVNYSAGISFDVTLFNNWTNRESFWSNSRFGTTLPIYNLKTDTWQASYGTNTSGADINTEITNVKGNFTTAIGTLNTAHNISKAYIAKDDMGKWSEHLYPQWSDATKDNAKVYNNCIYQAMNAYASDAGSTNAVKIKAMEKYATANSNGTISVDSSYNIPQFSNDAAGNAVRNAITSFYYADKLFTDTTPISYYLGNTGSITTSDGYAELVDTAYKQSFINKFTSPYSDDIVTLWTYIDTYCFLTKDSDANLLKYLQTIIPYEKDADLIWLAEDDTHYNASFATETDTTKTYGWQANPYGWYDSVYLPNANVVDTPSDYVKNSVYYHCAPMLYGSSTLDLAMGYVGLVSKDSTSSAITDKLSKALFDNTYYTKTTDDTGTTHTGGWVKYDNYSNKTSIEALKQWIIDAKNSINDIKDINTALMNANEDSDYVNYVYDPVNVSTFKDNDPEVTCDHPIGSPGEGITMEVIKARLLGGQHTYTAKDGTQQVINYDKVLSSGDYKGWGLNYYATQNAAKVTNLFTKFGSGSSTAELYNGSVTNPSHAIETDDSNNTYARMRVIQLNNNDVQSLTNLKAAIGTASTQDQMIALLAAQYASNSSQQSQSINDVIKAEYNGEKIVVFDRKFNDTLGTQWVKDWKATN